MRPQLLFLCQTLPFPPDGGVWIRTYHVMRLLARTFDITALCFDRAATSGTRTPLDVAIGREALRRFADVEVFPIPQTHNRLRYVWDHSRSVALRQVYTTFLYDSSAFHRRLADLLGSRRFDLVHADSLDLARYFPACDGIPLVCVHHDVQSALLQRRAAIDRNRWRQMYLKHQSALMLQEERRWCERVTLNVVVSQHDGAAVKRIAPASRVAVVPNGVDTTEYSVDATSGNGVAFVGGTNWFPNLDALEFFSSEILPHIRASGCAVPVQWIGSASVEQQRHYRERYGVELSGYVDDVRPMMRDAACHVVPLRAGSGTRLKILNAWAMGKAVVSTTIGCEGLAAIDGENILIRDDPKDFADAVVKVLGDHELRSRLGRRGRAAAEQLYSWEVIGENMTATYLALATGQADQGRALGGELPWRMNAVSS